ncbi:hypothetical protein FOPE_00007 [Fonsecaea pedrosoi]|nr:hypothetical protein FOPE_00007 [Fonsecaea pedrosoi]
METVTWIPERTVSIQDERYLHLVNVIKQKSDRLALFELGDKAAGRPLPSKIATSNIRDAHLVRRAQARRRAYQPLEWTASATATATESTEDLLYRGRGYHEYKKSEDHVFEVVHLIHRWPAELPYIGPLQLMMQQWPSIAGYGDGTVTYDKLRLSDHLDLDLASSWGPLVNMCRRNGLEARYKLIFLLATISFREEIDMRAIHTLMAFCLFPELKCIDLPSSPSYIQFRPGFRPRAEYVKRMLSCCALPFTAVGGSSCSNQRERKALAAAQRAYELQVVHDLEALVTSVSKQWPCPRPDLRQTVTSTLDLDLALSSIVIEWHTIFEHHTFEKHLWQVQAVLDRHTASHPAKTREILPEFRSVPAPRSVALSQLCLRDKEGPLADLSAVNIGDPLSSRQAAARPQRRHPDLEELNQIVAEIPISRSTVRQEYFRGLRHSMVALETYRDRVEPRQPVVDLAHLDLLIASATTAVDACMRELVDAVKKNEPGAMWLEMAGLWPPLSRVCVLETLRSIDPTPMTPSMRRAIIALGLEISQIQRLLRIQDANRRGRTQQVEEEVRNSGHTNWDVEKYADWLLLEIDADIMIRPIQAEVAFQIISPASGSNSVLQLNMGQGKTSTIIPLVASILANGKSLCRVVVPKALLLPTAQLLQARLGGLLGRELCHVPFSRRTSSSREQIETYQEIHASMLKGSGVVIALPEHIMSFMLSGQQRLLDGKVEEGIRMVDVQRWLSTKSRDVYDESDFTMAVKTQLIYPSGPQLTANGGTCRWRTIQMVLKLVYSHLSALEQSFESSIQVVQRRPGAFPFIHFLRTDVQHALTQRIVTDICDGRTTLLNVENFLPQDRTALQSFITEANPPRASVESVSEMHRTSPSEGHVIYLLRGLLVHRLLILTLSRRWNVQYGLHPHPARALAVPYLSKGVPSNLAEWGHVDVSLLLTCLSFYYQGLSPEQLQQSLEQISQSDDPAREYEQWVQGSVGLSDSHRDWTSINIEDTSQVSEIWCGVRYSMTAIDHFLNHFVFPQHAKQFKVKLQASGWDLPLAGRRVSLTTGFSGTNDNRLLLPLTIKQDDMEGLAHTNAEVLTYLLQSRNRAYSLAGLREVSGGKIFYRRLSEFDLLYKLYHMGIRILLDAGALILEMTNAALARMWLEIDVGAEAAVYFDEDNKAWVVTRAGRRTPLLASSYAEDLSACLVYLDESHTRGTDMKFPTRARGAVTLSLGQTKDHTVQAVMRLRQLATTQSITFFAPPEVHQSILDFRGKVDGGHLDSHDVVCWLLEQTCQGLENLQPLYYAQGVNYCRRMQAAHDHPRFITDPDERRAYLESLQDPEEQSLKSLYEPRTGKGPKQKDRVSAVEYKGNLIGHVRELERRRKAFRDTGKAVHASALQEVEQEREVAVEAETIRERQKPVFFHPRTFPGIAPELRDFVLKGALRTDDTIWEPAFSYMKRTGTGQKHVVDLPESQLLVSAEFRQAVVVPSGKINDDFLVSPVLWPPQTQVFLLTSEQRPVQWVLWSATTHHAVLVSPEEAAELIPLCRAAPQQVVHLLTYAAPVTLKMLQFNDLNYYSVPPLPSDWAAPLWVKIQVGIFAGRLYFPFEELAPIRAFLGLSSDDASPSQDDPATIMHASSLECSDAQDDDHQTVEMLDSTERDDPACTKAVRTARLREMRMLTFLHSWLGTRGRGQDFAHTPMGYICDRKQLAQDHSFFRSPDHNETRQSLGRHTGDGNMSIVGDVQAAQDEDDDSDAGEEELDTRHRLTAEELKMSAELAAHDGDSQLQDKSLIVEASSKSSNSLVEDRMTL